MHKAVAERILYEREKECAALRWQLKQVSVALQREVADRSPYAPLAARLLNTAASDQEQHDG